MRNRCIALMLLSLGAGLPGCAATRMDGGSPTFGPQAWNQAPAPPQRTIANTVPTEQPSAFDDTARKPVGLSKYFPGLQRPPVEPPKIATRYRPTWFGLRPNPSAAPAQPTTYMTDARAGLARPVAEPATLPVALQVPSPTPPADGAVKPAKADSATSTDEASRPAASSAIGDTTSITPRPNVPDFGGIAAKPGEDDVNPLPPALGSTSMPVAAVVDRMPEVPAVDPLERTGLSSTPPAQTTPEPEKTAPPVAKAPEDEKTVQAITPPSISLASSLPEPTVPASYAPSVVAQQAVGLHKHKESKVLASPQTQPTPQSVVKAVVKASPQGNPRPQAKSTSQAVPTSLTKPSPQAKPTPQSSAEPAAKTWQRPCLRRLVRRCFELGEFANPPTAAPH